MTEPGLDAVEVGVTARDRNRLFAALAERRRLERALRLLAVTLPERSTNEVASVHVEACCLVANARVGWTILPEMASGPIAAGPDAEWLDPAVDPTRWAAVKDALEGHRVRISDLSVFGADLGFNAVDASSATLDGRTLRSLCALPIAGGVATARGALVLAHHRAHAFSERQLLLVDALVEHLAHELEMYDAVADQARVATALQETLLPPILPNVDGMEIAARYSPSGSGNLVGGDFYDVFSDKAGGWYVLVGDVCGIGPEAAGLAGVARYTARALAESAAGPLEILAQVNGALLRTAPEDRFCTALIARFTPMADGTLSVALASGGHPTPFVQRATGKVEAASRSTGMVLGILPDATIGEALLSLEPGDAVVFYTDGVVEARASDGEQFGEERLMAVLEDSTTRSAAGSARRVERAVADHRSTGDHDDLAIVVVRCRPGADASLGIEIRQTVWGETRIQPRV